MWGLRPLKRHTFLMRRQMYDPQDMLHPQVRSRFLDPLGLEKRQEEQSEEVLRVKSKSSLFFYDTFFHAVKNGFILVRKYVDSPGENELELRNSHRDCLAQAQA